MHDALLPMADLLSIINLIFSLKKRDFLYSVGRISNCASTSNGTLFHEIIDVLKMGIEYKKRTF